MWLPGDEDGRGREARHRYLHSRPTQSHPPRKGARSKGEGQVLKRGGKHELRKEVKVSGEAIDQTGGGKAGRSKRGENKGMADMVWHLHMFNYSA